MPVSPRQARYLDALGVARYARIGCVAPAAVAPARVVAPPPEAQRPRAASPVPTLPIADPAAAWSQLVAQIAACPACDLSRTRTKTVPGVGDRQADWLIIGEAPGADEDATGEPFVGRAGKLLDAMLRAVGLDRQRGVYITNVVKCRPPGNRDPAQQEAAACAGYLDRQIALLDPKLVLSVGNVWHWRGTDLPVVATYHPAYLLRSPLEKRKSWDDLCLAQDVYRQRSGGAA